MNVILPVEAAQSEDELTMMTVDVLRVLVQMTDTEAASLVSGDAGAKAELCDVVSVALADAGVGGP